MFILETEQAKVISMKFLTCRVSAESTGKFWQKSFAATCGGHLEFLHKPHKHMQSLLVTFPKNRFPANFGGHLEFLRKM